MVYRDMRHYPYGQGTRHVYLLHFSRPLGHARHYCGQTARSVAERVEEHRAGQGARLTRLAVEAGIELVLARVWEDAPRCFEQRLKNRGGLARACPVCQAEERVKTGAGEARRRATGDGVGLGTRKAELPSEAGVLQNSPNGTGRAAELSAPTSPAPVFICEI